MGGTAPAKGGRTRREGKFGPADPRRRKTGQRTRGVKQGTPEAPQVPRREAGGAGFGTTFLGFFTSFL